MKTVANNAEAATEVAAAILLHRFGAVFVTSSMIVGVTVSRHLDFVMVAVLRNLRSVLLEFRKRCAMHGRVRIGQAVACQRYDDRQPHNQEQFAQCDSVHFAHIPSTTIKAVGFQLRRIAAKDSRRFCGANGTRSSGKRSHHWKVKRYRAKIVGALLDDSEVAFLSRVRRFDGRKQYVSQQSPRGLGQ